MTCYINEFSFRLNEGNCAIVIRKIGLDSLFRATANKTKNIRGINIVSDAL